MYSNKKIDTNYTHNHKIRYVTYTYTSNREFKDNRIYLRYTPKEVRIDGKTDDTI